MNYELQSLSKCLYSNRLSLNFAETTSMLIATKNALQDKNNEELLNAEFKISEELFVLKTYVRYLSIQNDNQLK